MLKADDITAIALSSDLQETGTLTTGNRLVNRLISNVEWGCRDNFVDVPTEHAETIIQALNGSQLRGCRLGVDKATPK